MKHKAWGYLLEGSGTPQDPHQGSDAQQKRERRDNLCNTAFICAASFACGLTTAQRGPSVLDLGYLTHSDLQRTASLFALGAGGHLTGCLATGFVYDKFHPPMFLFWSLVGLCAFTAAIPWCDTYGMMAAIYFLSIFCVGCVETGTYADIARRWRHQGSRVLQLLQLSFVIGGIVSPAFTRYFLMSTVRVDAPHASTNGVSAWGNEHISFSNQSSVDDIAAYTNISFATTWLPSPRHTVDMNDSMQGLKLNFSNAETPTSLAVSAENSVSDSSNNESVHDYPRPPQTKIHYAYAITAAVALVVAIPFIIGHWRVKKPQSAKSNSQTLKASSQRERLQENSVLALFLVGALFFLVTAVEESFHQFLFTFFTQEAHWSAGTSALVTGWFWCGMLLVRLAAYFLPDNVSPEAALTLSCVLLPCALSGLQASVSDGSTDGAWACVFFVGMACSLVFPVSFAWLHFCLNQKPAALSAVVMLSSSLAGVCNPLLLGYLFHEGLARTGFLYLLLAEACGALLVFLFLLALSRWLRAKWLKATNTMIVLEKFVASTMEQRAQDTVDIEDGQS